MPPVVIRSLGDLNDDRSKLVAYCTSCRRSQFLDLAALRTRYGAELSLCSLRARLRCSRCGARRPEVMHVWSELCRQLKVSAVSISLGLTCVCLVVNTPLWVLTDALHQKCCVTLLSRRFPERPLDAILKSTGVPKGYQKNDAITQIVSFTHRR
jgi:hypothetical protein